MNTQNVPEKTLVRWKIPLVIITLLLIAVFFFSRHRGKAEFSLPDKDIVARVGDRVITVEQFTAELDRRCAHLNVAADKKRVLDDLIDREARINAALSNGADQDPAVIRSYENRLIQSYAEKFVEPRLRETGVSEKEIQDYYQAHLADFTAPAMTKLAVLYVKTDPGMTDEQKNAKIKSIHAARQRALTRTGDERGFGALAVTESDDPVTRYRGGDLGWVHQDRIPARLDADAVRQGMVLADNGEISEVITGTNGLYVFKRLDFRDAAAAPLTDVSPRIRQTLLGQKKGSVTRAVHRELMARTGIQTFPDILNTIEVPTPTAVPAKKAVPPSVPGR